MCVSCGSTTATAAVVVLLGLQLSPVLSGAPQTQDGMEA